MVSRPRTQEQTIEPSSFGFRWFKLDEDLDARGNVLAYPVSFDVAEQYWKPNEGVQKQRIYSPADGYSASEDDVVPCWFNSAGRRWETFSPGVSSEGGYATAIGFTIAAGNTNLFMKDNGDAMNATVDYFLGGTTPPTTNGILIVHDDQEICPLACLGAMGWAVRNERLGSASVPYYQIVNCDQWALLARATIAPISGGGTGEGALNGPNTFQVSINNFKTLSESPHGMTADHIYAQRAFNPHFHRAMVGDGVTLAWGEFRDVSTFPGFPVARPGYIIIDVDKKTRKVAFDYRVNSSKKIEKFVSECAVEYSKNPEWEQMFPEKDC